MSALGERFRVARESRGLTLSDVAEQIRIRSVYLGAIEDENWSAIGAPVYIRGFLRTYARFLGLDPEEVVAQFNALSAATVAPGQPADSNAGTTYASREALDRPSRNLSPYIWAASIVAVLLIAFVFYNELTMNRSNSAAVAVSPTPLPSNMNAPPEATAGASAPQVAAPTGTASAHTLEVSFSSASWLRVTIDGNVSMEGTFPAGTVKQFHGKNAALRIGNAGGVAVMVDGKNLGKLGNTGDVVERSFAL